MPKEPWILLPWGGRDAQKKRLSPVRLNACQV
jgi:hypothetical protein